MEFLSILTTDSKDGLQGFVENWYSANYQGDKMLAYENFAQYLPITGSYNDLYVHKISSAFSL